MYSLYSLWFEKELANGRYELELYADNLTRAGVLQARLGLPADTHYMYIVFEEDDDNDDERGEQYRLNEF